VAGRLIHAPIVSLAAGRRLTDTTNGFRGYSRRFLLDPRVAPFRAIFDRYALLFYLSARAGQLGYRICEIPVTRRYPRNEKIPTKVSGVEGSIRYARGARGRGARPLPPIVDATTANESALAALPPAQTKASGTRC